MHGMAETEDPHSFLNMFEVTAKSCGRPEEEWAVRLLPLLVGEAQRAGPILPPASRVSYRDMRRAVLDRTGGSKEDYRLKFGSMKLDQDQRPVVLGQQLTDAETRWQQPGRKEEVIEKVILEQFLEVIPARTSAWVLYHRPQGLAAAVAFAEDHLAVQREKAAGGAERPVPVPGRVRPPPAEGAQPWSRPRNINMLSPPQGPAAADTAFLPQIAPRMPGQVCWRCGRLGHLQQECPAMVVGQCLKGLHKPQHNALRDPRWAHIRARKTHTQWDVGDNDDYENLGEDESNGCRARLT
ncbi:zinc finger and SCAN domain-containing protein 29-like [Nerophis ophidion]|uniref:zinc finger and SCAN domain-containing protein 29-like n=1 Tax=Nerophis ophidion TaxID=159077 RepID=UPI002ADF1D45|nr:zinc finger and SCAN domain-containing protein 29-like [Nerophis ophidion]